MKYQLFFFALTAMVVRAAVDDPEDFPECASIPSGTTIALYGCQMKDYTCICKNSDFFKSLFPAIELVCSAADAQQAENFWMQVCDYAVLSNEIGSSTLNAPTAAIASATHTAAIASATHTAPIPSATPTATIASTIVVGGAAGIPWEWPIGILASVAVLWIGWL